MSESKEQQIQRLIDGCTGEMAYRLFIERDPEFGNVFEQARQMASWGHSPADIVDRVLSGLTEENKKYAQENPHVRTLLLRATEYAAKRLDDKLHTAPLN